MDGRALFAIVDLTDERVVGTRWTNMGPSGALESVQVTERSLQNAVIMEDYCEKRNALARDGWEMDYVLTLSDGLMVTDVRHQGRLALKSVKLVEGLIMNKKNRIKRYLLFSIMLALLVGCGAEPKITPSPTPQVYLPVGPVTYCQAIPVFAQEMGANRPMLSTSLSEYVGAVLGDLDDNGNLISVYQHPSWDDAGYLGPITRDGKGNLYVSPVPKVSLVQNPLEDQNKIYRIDTDSGEMVEFLDVAGARPLTAVNPFGVIGLTYDCDTHSLYAATLAGSTAGEEVGRIVRIDLNTGQSASHLDNTDAIGLGVFNGLTGKRLYYGSARTPDIYSIGLDGKGDFSGEVRHEFSLAALEGGGMEKARRITFTPDSMMNITAIEFTYSLHSAIGDEAQVHYKMRYLPDENWGFVEAVH